MTETLNDAAVDPQQTISDVQRKLAERTAERDELLQQQTATADLLKVLSRSAFDLQKVLDTLVESAARLCNSDEGTIWRPSGDHFALAASCGLSLPKRQFLETLALKPGESNSLGRVLLGGETLHIHDVLADPDYDLRADPDPARTRLVVPLRRDGKSIGIFILVRKEVRPFNESQVELVQTFADQAVIAIENVRLFDEVQARTHDLTEALQQQTATADVLKVISRSAFDLQAVFDTLTTSAVDLLGMQSGTICVSDGEVFRFRSAAGAFWTEELWRYLQEHPVTPGRNTAAGRVILSGRIEQIPDILDDPEYAIPMQALTPGNTPRAMLGVPLLGKDRVEGAMVLSRQEPGPFTQREVDILQTFADQASIAIENTRLFNETQEALERQTASADILKVIASSPSDAQPVFNALVLTARRLLGRKMSAILLCGEDATFRAVAGAGPDGLIPIDPLIATPTKIDPVANFPSRAIVSRKNQHLPDWSAIDLPEEERRVQEMYGWNSTLYLPMLRGEKCIGVLLLGGTQPGIFSEADIALAESFRDQAVIAIENARLFNETKEALAYQTGSSNVLRVIASSPTDVEPVLKAIVESARELCEANDAVALLKDTEHLRFSAHSGPIAVTLDKWPISRNWTAGRAFVDQRPVHVHDMLSEEGAEFPDARIMGQSTGSTIHTVLSVPLLRGNESIGAILLRRTEVRPFNEKQINLLSTFADQAVIAIQNARLFNETQEALEQQKTSADILSVISHSVAETQPVFDEILRSVARLFGSQENYIFLVGEDDLLHVGAGSGPRVEQARELFPAPLDGTVSQLAIRERRLVSSANVFDDAQLPSPARECYRRLGENYSMVVAPMLWEDRAIGSIMVARTSMEPFSEKECNLLRTFADQAVIAIQNARLFNETREALERQTATGHILRIINQSPSDVTPVFDAIAERARVLCGALLGATTRFDGELLHLVGYHGVSPEAEAVMRSSFPRKPDLSSINGRCILAKAPVQIPDIELDPQYLLITAAKAADYRALLAVPMLQGGDVIGVIAVTRKEPGVFPGKLIELLQTFADQAVIAIQNADLFNEAQTRTRELSASLDELRTAQHRLVQTEKLASLGQLTAGIAHEIKNPLNFVNNFSALSAELIDEMTEVLENPALDEAERRKELDEIRELLKSNLEKVVQHGKRADSIVKNMLLHSREGAGEQRSADINALLEESLNLAYHGARAEKPGFNITLQRDLDPDAGAIEVFPQEITRAFINLISNGFYAASKRKTENGEADFEPIVSAATKNIGSHVEIRIRDNGTGIPPEAKDKIFNPFFTTKPAGEGTGLGLSMSHDIIVKQHGGRIEVDTQPGQFTEFIVVLPRNSNIKSKGLT